MYEEELEKCVMKKTGPSSEKYKLYCDNRNYWTRKQCYKEYCNETDDYVVRLYKEINVQMFMSNKYKKSKKNFFSDWVYGNDMYDIENEIDCKTELKKIEKTRRDILSRKLWYRGAYKSNRYFLNFVKSLSDASVLQTTLEKILKGFINENHGSSSPSKNPLVSKPVSESSTSGELNEPFLTEDSVSNENVFNSKEDLDLSSSSKNSLVSKPVSEHSVSNENVFNSKEDLDLSSSSKNSLPVSKSSGLTKDNPSVSNRNTSSSVSNLKPNSGKSKNTTGSRLVVSKGQLKGTPKPNANSRVSSEPKYVNNKVVSSNGKPLNTRSDGIPNANNNNSTFRDNTDIKPSFSRLTRETASSKAKKNNKGGTRKRKNMYKYYELYVRKRKSHKPG